MKHLLKDKFIQLKQNSLIDKKYIDDILKVYEKEILYEKRKRIIENLLKNNNLK